MSKFIAFTLLFAISAAGAACGSAGTSDANTAANSNVNGNAAVKTNLDPANLPEGFDPKPIQPSANETPGIPKDPLKVEKGATPTPGIPSQEELKRGVKPGATPTPGIPSPAELEKMRKTASNVNAVPPGATDNVPAMKSMKRIQNANKQ
ncbi:MAG TPA: hypothetical protein PKC65_01200 [Pyrinomonadaceae bacterium]|nr:hypothetical protein [Pyrinomonadaceae bacterium]